MAYLGSGMEEVEKTVATCNIVCDMMTGNGSLATMTIGASQEMPGHVNNVSIYFDGVAQRPTTDYTLSGKTVTFSTVPETGVNVVCLSYADEYLDVISDATVYGSEILDGAITDAKIATGISASKLTGALPAVDGSAVTNFSPRAVVKNASDPTVSTNHANGVGTVWANTTSGEMFICTNATAGANVWTNVGAGTGDVQPYRFQGTIAGYVYGGTEPTSGDVQKFSFTSDGNATDVGNQSVQRNSYTAASSTTHGYCMGGSGGNVIDKFAFASAGGFTMSDVGNLTQSVTYPSGMSTESYGFRAGGSPNTDRIDRLDFSSDGNATDWANLHTARSAASNGISGATHGYVAGGASDQIQKFQYSSQSNGTDVGNLLRAFENQSGATSSTTHGYVVGSSSVPTAPTNVIQKFPFASDTNSTDVGNITQGVFLPGTASSTTHGYRAGGDTGSGGNQTNVIDKWANASDGNATDVGDLAHTQNYLGQGSQY
jgi:hypothetical protein